MTHIIHDMIADRLSPHKPVRQNGMALDSDSIHRWAKAGSRSESLEQNEGN